MNFSPFYFVLDILENLYYRKSLNLNTKSDMEWSLVFKLPRMSIERKRNVFDRCYGISEERIICRWKCSLWKLVLKELFIYGIIFLSVSLLYRSTNVHEN